MLTQAVTEGIDKTSPLRRREVRFAAEPLWRMKFSESHGRSHSRRASRTTAPAGRAKTAPSVESLRSVCERKKQKHSLFVFKPYE